MLEGLVEAQPHRTAVVASISQGDIDAAYEARRILEPAAARLAAQRRDPATLAALEAAAQALMSAGHDLDAELDANRRFHIALVAGAGNPHLSRLIEELWDERVVPFIYARQALSPSRAERDSREHAEIARLIASGDAEGAARAVDEHIAAAFEGLRSAATPPPD